MVLPVVARKKGLDGQYEQADGSPKPRPDDSPVKPVRMIHTSCTCIDGFSTQAPGTFGYDYTKYRPPRHEDEEIQMHEFGQLPEQDPLPEEDVVTPRAAETSPRLIIPPLPPVKLEEPIRLDPRQTIARPPESPAPFARYRIDQQVPTINITRPSLDTVEHRQAQEDDDAGGGCCKCVIM